MFSIFNFATNFLENENLIQNIEYHFSVETTNIENASFPYETTMSEANVKRNRMTKAN